MELSRSKQLGWETISLRFAKREVYRAELSQDLLYPLKNKVLGGGEELSRIRPVEWVAGKESYTSF